MAEHIDIIDKLASIHQDTPLAQLRGLRPGVAGFAQGSYLALLEPADLAGVSRRERELVALRVAVLSSLPALAEHHRAQLRQLGATDVEIAAIEQFPAAAALPPREFAILQHTDLLTNDPAGASRAAVDRLHAHGLGVREIVTITQLIAFLSFQVRVLAGLRLLAEEL